MKRLGYTWHISAGLEVAKDIQNQLSDFGIESVIDMDCIYPPCLRTTEDGNEFMENLMKQTYGVWQPRFLMYRSVTPIYAL